MHMCMHPFMPYIIMAVCLCPREGNIFSHLDVTSLRKGRVLFLLSNEDLKYG